MFERNKIEHRKIIPIIAEIFEQTCKTFQLSPDKQVLFAKWFIVCAIVRSNLDPNYQTAKSAGVFDIPNHVFDEMKIRLNLESNVSGGDFRNHIRASLEYFKWAMKKFRKKFDDDVELLKCVFLTLDLGYYKVEKTLDTIGHPVSFGVAASMIEDDFAVEKIVEMIAIMSL